MTRKHFRGIAQAVANARIESMAGVEDYHTAVDEVAYNLASVLAQHNDRFDRNVFLEACGVHIWES